MKKMIFCCALVVGVLVAGIVSAQGSEKGQVYLVKRETSDQVVVDVMVKGVLDPLLGVAFRLRYSEGLEFSEFEKGDLLESGGDMPIYMVRDLVNGSGLTVGVSLKRGDVLPRNDGRLISFIFRRQNLGEVGFSFENQVAVTLEDDRRRDLDNVEWVGDLSVLFVDAAKNQDLDQRWLPLMVLMLLAGVLVVYFVYSLQK